MGLTVTAAPLMAGRLPGVMMPVPFANTPVRVALDPFVMEVGFAVKLVIEGGGDVCVLDDPPPQPVRLATPRMTVVASGARTSRTKRRFIIPRIRSQVKGQVKGSGRSQRPLSV